MACGWVYLCAIVDWASRPVLPHRVSIGMDTALCLEALEEAFAKQGQPEIFNTDQGSQFTSEAFTAALKARGIKSAWTAEAASATTSSWSGCGARSSTRRCTCMPTSLSAQPRPA